MLAENPKKRRRVLYRVINGLFRDPRHCLTAYESEKKGKQHDERFKAVQHGWDYF